MTQYNMLHLLVQLILLQPITPLSPVYCPPSQPILGRTIHKTLSKGGMLKNTLTRSSTSKDGVASKEDDSSIWLARRVPVVMPISPAMAIYALHMLLRYREKSDGLVTCHDVEVPGSVVIRPDKKLDHGRMVHFSWKKNPDEPDPCEMCEAILTLLVELGKAKL
ncbi:hypothetical protein Nepgr_014867 [Nepenthes gracilis]|uniref:Uncharacterized protein n=1 Tax=Nepenthes gracilis TaxID=150966 RepID=A0AAD3SLZ9_NEPGR|nr:hypothetical protein Nepgr_014867 [Nepenthes gracilis]